MVKLIVNNLEQITILEYLLTKQNIQFFAELEGDTNDYGLIPPYMIVDSVPLDFNRSLKWIKEHENNE